MLTAILPVEDAEISAFAQKAFAKQGMTILTGARCKRSKGRARRRCVAHGERAARAQDVTVDRR